MGEGEGSMSYYRVVHGATVLGCGTYEEMRKVIDMHKHSLNGVNKPSYISGQELRIEEMQGEYPPKNASPIVLNYKPDKVK
jgi:hypothetical protein